MKKLVRIIDHWSVTAYKADDDCRRHYHYTIEGDGTEVAGFKRPEANLSTSDRDYVGHTLNCNEGSIGVACAAMLGAIWPGRSPEQYGKYPVIEKQFEAMCLRNAKLCKKYGIKVTSKTVLMHGEVQENLGIHQRGKWDIGVLPYKGLWDIKACGDYMRERTLTHLAKI